MNDPENYLNPPEAAIRERGARLSDMGPKLRATMERLHGERKSTISPVFDGILDIMRGQV